MYKLNRIGHACGLFQVKSLTNDAFVAAMSNEDAVEEFSNRFNEEVASIEQAITQKHVVFVSGSTPSNLFVADLDITHYDTQVHLQRMYEFIHQTDAYVEDLLLGSDTAENTQDGLVLEVATGEDINSEDDQEWDEPSDKDEILEAHEDYLDHIAESVELHPIHHVAVVCSSMAEALAALEQVGVRSNALLSVSRLRTENGPHIAWASSNVLNSLTVITSEDTE